LTHPLQLRGLTVSGMFEFLRDSYNGPLL